MVVDPNAPKANKAGPDYRAPFSFENQACYGRSEALAEPKLMVLAMIKSKKDHEAIEWGRNEAPKFDLFFDYVFYGHFEHNYIRF